MTKLEFRKSKISLPIVTNNPQERLLSPQTWVDESHVYVQWKYKATSFACQGDWCEYIVAYSRDKYDYNEAMEKMTKFIKREYEL